MKKLIVILSIIVLILGIFFTYIFFQSKNEFKRNEQEFYNAISLLKEEKYNEAYQLSNSIKNIENQKVIKNIIAYSYLEKIIECVDKVNESESILTNLIQKVSISNSIYSRIDISEEEQNKIDKIDEEIMQKYGELNITYPKEILYEDLGNLFNSFGEFIKSYNGLNSGLKEKLSNDTKRNQLVNDLTSFTQKLEELSKYVKDVEDLHPANEIPEQYRIMFDFDNGSKK